MSNKGYLSERREKQLAKILDAAVDFDEILKTKKILGVIKIGNVLERHDRQLFQFLIATVDDSLIGKDADSTKVEMFEKAISFLENEDYQGFADHVAGILEGTIDIPYIDYDRQIYLAVLMLFNGIMGKCIDKIEKLIAKAEAEAQN